MAHIFNVAEQIWVLFGTLFAEILSLLWIYWTRNPARIPPTRIFFRALPGIITSFIIAGSVSILVYDFWLTPLTEKSSLFYRNCVAVLAGIITPTLGIGLKNFLVTEWTIKHIRWLVGPLQGIDEFSRLYYSRIIAREERKIGIELPRYAKSEELFRRGVHRLFEFYLLDIARYSTLWMPRTAYPHFFEVRNYNVKLRHLIRFFGYRECRRFLLAEEVLLSLFPSWPKETGERRQGRGDPGKGKYGLGRRKYDNSYALNYVLAGYDIPHYLKRTRARNLPAPLSSLT